MGTDSYATQPVWFDSDGTRCAGMLYRPAATALPVPCVVLAHGFSGTMDWIVPDFAERFAAGGIAALTFDYRYLGASGGEPRQLISTPRQRADLAHAVEFARGCDGIDARRIALWGTSLGGAHVVNLAGRDPAVAAVVANVPGLDVFRGALGRAETPGYRVSTARAVAATGRLLGAAVLDAARGALGLSPHYIAVYGRLGEAVFMDPGLAELFRNVEQNSPTWRNEITPRFLFTAPRYREGTMERITAPLLVTLARDDEVISSAFVADKAAKAPRHEIREYPARHFEMYHGAMRDRVAADHLDFLRRHLLTG
ncbi:alpha/beta fold hydrolase [Mycolicibacterium sp. ND9-15]|uniref:alpha/beta hydrolase n=1 Tax=Mycolicibacterium sp. ND9-15 TaxID=3042320 RepID=UPI002DD96D29|nr:alpha/beta fold hydrolase [Mycolicibacterium sp. ND9-15]WSE57615.1 alpha/beta fold hydrolase [Mycolicibacterium sp. ND9-15]